MLVIKKIHDKYLLKLPVNGSYDNSWYEVDGKVVRKSKTEVEKIWLNFEPKKIVKFQPTKKVVSYGDLSIDEYTKRKNELHANADEYDCFRSVDDEYAYKKFIETYKPVYEDYIDEKEEELQIVEITGRVDNKYIVPFRFIGNDETKDSLYQYIPKPIEMCRDIGKQLGFTEVEDKTWNNNTDGFKWSSPSHSHDTLRFIKINNEYSARDLLLPKRNDEPQFYSVQAGTWEECEEKFNLHYNAIKDMFLAAKRKIETKGVCVDVAAAVSNIDSVIRLVRNIDAKNKSEISPQQVVNKLLDFKKELLKN